MCLNKKGKVVFKDSLIICYFYIIVTNRNIYKLKLSEKFMAPIYEFNGKWSRIIGILRLGKRRFDLEPPNIDSFTLNPNLVKSDYVPIPNQNFAIAIGETDCGLNYGDAHRQILKRKLYVPEAFAFMPFHNHIIYCYKNNKPIFDAAGNPVSDKVKKDLYRQLTEKCRTWLNGKFHISPDEETIEYVTGLDSDGNLLTRREKLETCLMKDCIIDFTKLNEQGLAKPDAEILNQQFVKGENIYFFYPRDNSVVGFSAGSDMASLHCVGGPHGRSPSLGVRAKAQIAN